MKKNQILRICQICGNNFYVKPYIIKIGKGKFCSPKCYHKYGETLTGEKVWNWKGGKIVKKCKLCGKEFRDRRNWGSGKNRGFFCSSSCAAINRIKTNSTKTSGTYIEIILAQELTRRGVNYKSQYPIWQAKTIPDFFIEPNIVIYADGDYWHNLPKSKIKDFNQNYWLEFLGYKVYRFWEHDIKSNAGKCIDRIVEISK